MAFYDESAILAMASMVGTPVNVDTTTMHADRSRFRRVCVEIDLMKPVIGEFG